ncbi:NADH-quinone oxidoreductase subunit NuoK [bacterium]|nr:NADH-quinone oxidoreductase subunit NuoK [bacterium]
MISSTHILILSSILFSIGLIGVIIRRNAIVALMCVELMLNAGLLGIIGSSLTTRDPSAQILVLFIMLIAAAEVAVGLAIIVMAFQHLRDTDLDNYSSMKW